MDIEVDHRAFRTAVGGVTAGADALRAASRDLDREVDSLMSGGWTGAAAESFAGGWAEWRSAAGGVLDGLVAMGQLLEAVHADLTDRDVDARSHLDAVARRITTRLEP
jgi:WXG100 family type VII secretion target